MATTTTQAALVSSSLASSASFGDLVVKSQMGGATISTDDFGLQITSTEGWYALQVNSPYENPLRVRSTDGTGGIDIGDNSSTNNYNMISVVGDSAMKFYTNNAEKLTLTDAGVIVNDASYASFDFRVEGNDETHTFFSDSGANKVTIGTSVVGDEKFKVAGNVGITGSLHVSGNITTSGSIIAREFRTEFVNQIIATSSGSTTFGDDLADTHRFTGSMAVTGAIWLTNDLVASNQGEIQLGAGKDGKIYSYGDNLYFANETSDKDIYINVNDGGSHGTAIFIDGSENRRVSLPNDNQQLAIGASNDLALFHDGTDTKIENAVGNLIIYNYADDKDIILKTDDGSGGTTAYLTLDGSAGLTQADKNIKFVDSIKAQFGNSSDLEIWHDGSNTYIENEVGDFQIYNKADDKDIILSTDDGSGGTTAYITLDGSANTVNIAKQVNLGTVALTGVSGLYGASNALTMYNNTYNFKDASSNDLFTITSGGKISGSISTTGSFGELDVNKSTAGIIAQFQYGSDTDGRIQIYADANAGSIGNDSGLAGETIYFQDDLGQRFYTGGVERMRITTDGRVGIGTSSPAGNAPSLHLSGSGNDNMLLVGDNPHTTTDDRVGWSLGTHINGNIYYDHKVNSGGIIDFRYGEGTEQGYAGGTFMRVDATEGEISFFDDIHMAADSKKIFVGAGDDFQIYHDGSNTSLQNGTGALYLNNVANASLHLSTNNTTALTINTNQDTVLPATKKLYLDGGSDTYIYEAGADYVDYYVGGALIFRMQEASDNVANVPDNVFLGAGDSFDLRLSHNGSHSYIQNATGNLYIRGQNSGYITIDNASGTEALVVDSDSELRIYHAGTEVFQTRSDGFTLPAAKKLYFDGGSNTYIHEQSADDLEIVVGGNVMQKIEGQNVTIGGGYYISSSLSFFGKPSTPVHMKYGEFTCASEGWHRLARCGTVADGESNGTRASAKFTVYDTDSSEHSVVTFYASGHFGKAFNIRILNGGSYGAGHGVIEQIRIVHGTTYEGFGVDVYIKNNGDSNVRYVMEENYQELGWTPENFSAQSADPPTNMAATAISCSYASSNVVDGFATGNAAANGSVRWYRTENGVNFQSGSGGYAELKTNSRYRIVTDSGYLELGPQNGSYNHILHDLGGGTYFNRRITVDEGLIGSYDENLALMRAMSTDDQIVIEASETKVYGDAVERCKIGSYGIKVQRDDYRLWVGASDDWSVRHNGTNTIIDNITGHLHISQSAQDKDIKFSINDGGTIKDTMWIAGSTNRVAFGQPVKLYFANGQSIYDNGGGGLALNGGTYDLDLIGGTNATGDIRFFADGVTSANSEKMKLKNGGRFEVSTSMAIKDTLYIAHGGSDFTPGLSFMGGTDTAGVNDYENCLVGYYDNSGTGTLLFEGKRDAMNFQFNDSDECLFYMAAAGDFHAEGDVIAASTTTNSDIRLKKNINNIPYGLNEVLQLRPVEFDWKKKRSGVHDIGVIAQEVEEIIPEIVNKKESKNDGIDILSVDYGKLTAVLIKSIQELTERVEELEGDK